MESVGRPLTVVKVRPPVGPAMVWRWEPATLLSQSALESVALQLVVTVAGGCTITPWPQLDSPASAAPTMRSPLV
jgi:hypothetical protein